MYQITGPPGRRIQEERMRYQGRVVLGIIVILFGLAVLFGAVFRIDVGNLVCAGLLIFVGAVLLLRAFAIVPAKGSAVRIFGPLRRGGAWQVAEEDIWVVLGDVRLDFTQAEIPAGETPIRVFSFLGNLRALVPEGVGVSVVSNALINDVRLLDQRGDGFLVPVELATEGYETAERRISLEATYLISNVRVRRPQL
jgi:predicted membrane protein